MLVLTRHDGQKIVLPALGVTFTVVRIEGDRVRIGIEAPRDVKILRNEHFPLKALEDDHDSDRNP